MRLPVAALCLVLGTSSALAGNGRWTTGFGQGTLEAIIENGQKASVNLYCPEGQEDKTPGMFVDSKKVRPVAKEKIRVQFIVDGVTREFVLDEIQFLPATKSARAGFYDLAHALAASRQNSFVVKFPKSNVEETFPLNGARKALGLGKDSILEECRQPNE